MFFLIEDKSYFVKFKMISFLCKPKDMLLFLVKKNYFFLEEVVFLGILSPADFEIEHDWISNFYLMKLDKSISIRITNTDLVSHTFLWITNIWFLLELKNLAFLI